MEKYYGQKEGSAISLFGLEVHDHYTTWRSYRGKPKRDKIYNYSWKYDQGGYGTFSYSKPGLMMLTLHNYLGDETMKKVMRTYYDRFSFKHPTSRDFINTVNDVSGEDLNWFFDQVLYGTDVLDYKVSSITSKRIPDQFLGIFGNPLQEGKEDTVAVKKPDSEDDGNTKPIYKNKIIITREGEVIFPIDIMIRFKNGEEKLEHWDGKERYIVYEYESESSVVSAEVDPERKVWLDINFLNNGRTVKSGRATVMKYSTRYFFWMQNLLQYLAIFG